MCADQSAMLLQATDLNLRYGKHSALSNINVQLHAGDTLGLLGLNGAGKSSLLKVLSGVLAPQSGSVCIDGHDMSTNPTLARQQIGYAADVPPVYPQFRVQEFLQFTAELRKVPRSSIKSQLDAVLQKCGLGAVRSRVIGNLSHGYRQRINLAQALIHEPRVLILDEPANGLDPAQLQEMRALIHDIQQQQATIFSSHLLSEVQQVCNRVVVINNGSKIVDMPLSEISSHLTYEVILQEAARQTDLQNLPGVLRVCSVDAQHWLVTTKPDSDNVTCDSIGEALLARGLQLLEVNPVRDHLDKLFSQLKLNANKPGIAIGESL